MATGLQRQDTDGNQGGGIAGRRSLIIALVLVLGIMIAEIIGGLLSGSLALLADAGHMLATASAIAIALFVAWAESRPASIERTFGYHRAEVIGAMLSALALWLVAAWVLFESINRLRDRSELEIEGRADAGHRSHRAGRQHPRRYGSLVGRPPAVREQAAHYAIFLPTCWHRLVWWLPPYWCWSTAGQLLTR